jgi:nickel-dependent lactate racemase
MEIKLKYGEGHKTFEIPAKNVLGILEMKHINAHQNPEELIRKKIESPIASPSLHELIRSKQPQNIVIIVSDITRPGPFALLLKILLQELLSYGVSQDSIHIQIANGTHRKLTESEMRYHYGDWVVDDFSIANHDCRADDLVSLGTMKSGNELRVNKKVAEADFIITIGVISPHYFAGYSGGRKSILPGVCGYETIRHNHSNIIHSYAALGKLDGNKIHLEMAEAAAKVGVNFTLQAVLNHKKELVQCFAGALNDAFYEGVKFFNESSSVKFSQKADALIVSAGGYPKDLNFYQSQRALNNTFDLVKDGGTVILVTESRENMGQEEMEKQLRKAKNIDDLFCVDQKDIQIGGHRAFATGRLLKQADILIVSSMDPELVKAVHFTPSESIKEALEFVRKKEGDEFSCYVIPNGSMFFPNFIKN